MSLFLLSKNNLADVDDIEQARSSLRIGSSTTSNINEVLGIKNGYLKIDDFQFTNNGDAIDEGYILTSTNSNGYAKWEYLDIQSKVSTIIDNSVDEVLSNLDRQYITHEEIDKYLKIDTNLSEANSIEVRSNLDLWNPTFNEVQLNSLVLPSFSFNNSSYFTNNDSNELIQNYFVHNLEDGGNNPPTADAVNEVILGISNVAAEALRLTSSANLISKNQHLSELEISDYNLLYQNLGLPLQVTNHEFTISNIIVDGLKFSIAPTTNIYTTFLSVDETNQIIYKDLQSTQNNFGLVKTVTYENAAGVSANEFVIEANSLYSKIEAISLGTGFIV